MTLPHVSDRKLFGVMILGAYVLALGALAFIPVPETNKEQFGQLMMGLVGAMGVIVGAVWKTTAGEERGKDATSQALQTLADKVPPSTTEIKP